MANINMDKHVWEGWTVKDFVEALKMQVEMIMNNQSWQKPFTSKLELKNGAWIINHIIKNIFQML